jgi:CheY-like chemotaxis protein
LNESGATPVVHSQKRAVVLVVDDEPLTLLDAVEMIEEAGYEAIWARNADQAIAILERRDDIRVLFTDVNMPGSMDGMKLAHAVRGRWPPVEIIVASGMPMPTDAKLPDRGLFFLKPYDPEKILDAIHGLAA